MSQYLVEPEHLNAILTWGLEFDFVEGPIQKLFQDLYRDNLESLAISYPNEEYVVPKTWKYRPETLILRGIKKYDIPIAVGIYKLIENWKHQSDRQRGKNNHGWNTMNRLEKMILEKLGLTHVEIKTSELYKTSPWSYTPKKWKEFRSYLTKAGMSNEEWSNKLRSPQAPSSLVKVSELEQTLNGFTGTTNYHRLNKMLCPNFVCTDGVLHLMEKASCYWLCDIIMSVQYMPKIKAIDPQFWQLDVDLEEGSAKIICHDGIYPTEESNIGKIIYSQDIPMTDFPHAQQKIWVGKADNRAVATLPSEY